VSPALILDTGVLLWMSQGSDHLGPRTTATIEEASQRGSLYPRQVTTGVGRTAVSG
jgi:PIN domain nuclease of toxin-antitoxin system